MRNGLVGLEILYNGLQVVLMDKRFSSKHCFIFLHFNASSFRFNRKYCDLNDVLRH